MLKYYKILGIRLGASQSQIRKAYYKQAKKLHPDINKSANSEAEFIKLNDAYEILTNPKYKTPKTYKNKSKATKKSKEEKDRAYQDWVKKKREELRKSGQRRARMKHAEFVKYSTKEVFFADLLSVVKRVGGGVLLVGSIIGVVTLLATHNILYFLYSYLIIGTLFFTVASPIFLVLIVDFIIGIVRMRK